MSISTTNFVGTKISTRIRQAGFDPLDIEALMYMGDEVVPMYTHALKRSTWAQLTWNHLQYVCGERDGEVYFNINGLGAPSLNSMDYLLAVALEATFPKVTLVNTPAPVQFVALYQNVESSAPDAQEILDANDNENLYYYVSDGSINGLPSGQLYVGSYDALTNTVQNGGLAIPANAVAPLRSYSPRHKVGWGQNALLAAIESVAWMIDGVEYEELSRHALYNAIQYRMREDVYPVAGEEATSLPALEVSAALGTESPVVIGGSDDERYKGFFLPHSFTTSGLTDRGENGKFKSAFPVLLACKNLIQERITLIDDLRKILILEEECLDNVAAKQVIFVATPQELGVVQTEEPTNTLYFTDGVNVWSIAPGQFSPLVEGELQGPWVVGSSAFTWSKNGVPTTNVFLVSNMGAKYVACTGVYYPITRPNDYSCDNPYARDVDYSDWIVEEKLTLNVRARALGAIVTDLERGMMKADCRGKRWLYERYSYFEKFNVRPGDKVCVTIDETPGQTKYVYTFAQNENSRLQGQFFNYTNDTDFLVIADGCNHTSWCFEGKDSLERIGTRIQGFRDEDHPSKFYRYIDNPLFAQRAPRQEGLHIAPRYANWINAIYPDGSINGNWSNAVVCVKTTPSGLDQNPCSSNFGKCNTYSYNVVCIVVAWNIVLFELAC